MRRRGRKRGRSSTSSGGGNDGGLSLAEKPLYGLAVGFVAEFSGELKHPRRTDYGHTNSPTTAVYLAVPVLGRRLLDTQSRRRLAVLLLLLLRWLVRRVFDDSSAVNSAVSSTVCSQHEWVYEGREFEVRGGCLNFLLKLVGLAPPDLNGK